MLNNSAVRKINAECNISLQLAWWESIVHNTKCGRQDLISSHYCRSLVTAFSMIVPSSIYWKVWKNNLTWGDNETKAATMHLNFRQLLAWVLCSCSYPFLYHSPPTSDFNQFKRLVGWPRPSFGHWQPCWCTRLATCKWKTFLISDIL